MKTLLHISDIHFGGPQAPNRLEALLEEVERRQPTLVAFSGDLTQRARTAEFRQARAFLDLIQVPILVVPGNHDVPLWNVYDRFTSPLEKYKRWITADLSPTYFDDELAVVGIDTTRSLTVKGGKINQDLIRSIRQRICHLPPHVCKILVAHHPLAPPPGQQRERGVRGAAPSIRAFEECGVDLVLTGHLHESHAACSLQSFPSSSRSVLLVHAGTAASLRGRGSELAKNSFNYIEITPGEIRVTPLVYSEEHRQFLGDKLHVSKRPPPA